MTDKDDEMYHGMSRACRYVSALKAGDLPGCHAVLRELNSKHNGISAFTALGALCLDAVEDLCKLTGQDAQQLLDAYACSAIAAEAGDPA